jgi:hypothetical protein
VIHEVDEGLRLLLAEYGLQEGGVELVFDPPTKEWSARRNAPTLNVFLYGLHEDLTRRQTGTAEDLDDDGTVIAWRTPPRWFELAYLVTAWTNRPQDEHRLLSQALSCLVGLDVLPEEHLTGTLADLGLRVQMRTSAPSEGLPSVSDVWSALGAELKPSIDLRVLAPLAGAVTPAGQPAAEGLVVRVGNSSGAYQSDVVDRHLRYRTDQHGTDADTGIRTARGSGGKGGNNGSGGGSQGFSAPRPRPLPPARRRRGGSL